MAQASSTGEVLVKASELPVFCPNPAMPLWSSHPRVYLDIGESGEQKCPYCGTVYRLDGPRGRAGH